MHLQVAWMLTSGVAGNVFLSTEISAAKHVFWQQVSKQTLVILQVIEADCFDRMHEPSI